MKTRRTVAVAAMMLLMILLTETAFAAGRTYVDRRRVIRVGVLVAQKTYPTVIDVNGVVADPVAPYIFYIMDQRVDIKPAGWSFMNPLAGGRDAFKNYADYWKVPLKDTTLDNLAKFDVLYLNANTTLQFRMDDRDKLRRFIDGGGCLWIDDGATSLANVMQLSSTPAYEFFLDGIDFNSPVATGASPLILASLHPLLTNPFWLGPQEVGVLNSSFGATVPWIELGDQPGGPLGKPSPTTLAPIVATASNKPTIAAIEYGSGRVVVTSGFIGMNIQGPVCGVAMPPAPYMPSSANVLAANPSNLRFAYNVVQWASSWTTLRKGYRHNGVSLENIGAPLVNKWMLPKGASTAPEVESNAVVWKNVIFYTSGNTLYALDAIPEEDLDMDGNVDDGHQWTAGDPPGVDIIWQQTVNTATKLSTPTVASMIDPADGKQRDFVFVTADDPQFVHAFVALPGGPRISGVPDDRSTGASCMWDASRFTIGAPSSGSILSAPIVQNGWVYAGGLDGIVRGYSPVYATPTSGAWQVPIQTVVNGSAGTIKSAMMLGFVKNRQNGAVVQQLSFVGQPPNANPVPNDTMYALPVFVSSDRLRPQVSLTPAPDLSHVPFTTSYAPYYISSYPAPKVWAVDTQGNPVNGISYDSTTLNTPSPGCLVITGLDSCGVPAPNVRVYMSYALDYTHATQLSDFTIQVGYPLPPSISMSPQNPQATITGSPAIGPNDSYYMGVNWNTDASGFGSGHSAVYSVDYQGRGGGNKLKWPYFLHGGGTNFASPAFNPTVATPPMSLDQLDPAHKWGIFSYESNTSDPSGTNFTKVGPEFKRIHAAGLEVVGTPAVTNERVFVLAKVTGTPKTGQSKAFLLCFKADQTFQIRCNRPFIDQANGQHRSVSIWQPDMLFSNSGSGDVSMLARQLTGGGLVDYDTGTITITDFSAVRLRTYMPGGTSMIVDGGVLTPSLPVWVFVDGNPIPIEQIDFSSWNNLIWAMPIIDHDCAGVSGSPVVIGDYVYFSCDDGDMYAVDTAATPMDADYRLLLEPLPASTDPDYNKKLAEWDARVPMRQKIDSTAGPAGNSSMSGACGLLAVPTTTGLYTFNNPLTLVTDNHRIMEIGGDGKVTWACDSVYEPKQVNAAVSQPVFGVDAQSLNKPVVAQKFGGSDYLVVDSGNDRVLRIDRGGQVMWSIKSFVDPLKLLRSGESLTIKNPSDARMWTERVKETVGGTDNYYYDIHCLVVDTGNFRIVDVIDRFNCDANGQVSGPVLDSNNNPIGHQLRWVSNTTYRDKRFTFNCVQMVRGSTSNGDTTGEVDQIWASVSNFGMANTPGVGQPASGGGHLGGAIVALDYRKSNADYEWVYGDGVVEAQLSTVMNGTTKRQLSSPRYFQVLESTSPRLLICDSSAVYETTGSDGSVSWYLDDAGYQALPRQLSGEAALDSIKVNFSPYHIQKLASRRYVIVNSYAGRTNDPRLLKFTGEVFELDPTTTKITWYAPDLVYTAGPPTDIVQRMKNAPNLDQPTCAQRVATDSVHFGVAP